MFLTSKIFDDEFFKLARDNFYFNSTVKDMYPATYYKKDKDYIIEIKTLGIAENDIKIKLDDANLIVFGETKNEFNDQSFNTKATIILGEKIVNDLESIDYKVQNGLTYVFLRMKESSKSNIQISKL